MLIKLPSGMYINPHEVSDIGIPYQDANFGIVTMNNGTKHRIDPEYKTGIYTTVDSVVKSIQGVTKND